MRRRLDEVHRRIDRLHRCAAPQADGWQRVLVPVLRVIGWRPELDTSASRRLLDASRQALAASPPEKVRVDELDAAMDELERNVSVLERAALVYEEVPAGHVAWLSRVHGWLTSIDDARRGDGPLQTFVAASVVPSRIALPLCGTGDAQISVGLGAVDALMGAAADEVYRLGRRRRLLEGARRVLLDLSAGLELPPEAVALRRDDIVRGIVEVNRLQGAGLRPDVDLSYQLRQARRGGRGADAYTALQAISSFSMQRGDVRTARAAYACTRALDAGAERDAGATAGSATTIAPLPGELLEALRRTHRQQRAHVEAALARATMGEVTSLRRRAAHIAEGATTRLAMMALVADGYFDVGGTISPLRVGEDVRRRVLVRHPAPEMRLTRAESPADAARAVIEDPRTLLYQLASGRLLCRSYVADETRSDHPQSKLSQVRIYVLDGSASMTGPRARMRDALLITELGTLMKRLQSGDDYVHALLYYRYFDHEARPTRRVATLDEAVAAAEDALTRTGGGRTDIEGALIDSFRQIRQARTRDPALTHAQIVLVTDGEAELDPARVLNARATIGAEHGTLPSGVSVVSLGNENPNLRALAAEQRRLGERVFYHHVSDAELERWEDGEGDVGATLRHLGDARVVDGTWLTELSDELDTTEALGRHLPETLEDAELHLSALDQMEAGSTDGKPDAERAHWEAMRGDLLALTRRFNRWFPDALPTDSQTLAPAPGHPDHAALADVNEVLSVVVELGELLTSSGAQAMVDAIEVAERLLFDAGLSPSSYARLISTYPASVAQALRLVRARGHGAYDAP